MSASETAIERRESGEVTVRAYSPQQIRLLKQQLMPRASDDDVSFFVQYCQYIGLDPFVGQVWAIPQKDSDTGQTRYRPFTGIDGLRLTAERTGEYQGTDIVWKAKGGPWVEVWEDDQHPPYAAKATVYRLGRRPVSRIVKYREFVRKNRRGEVMDKWATAPAHQLGVRAEAHALRTGFPRETQGLQVDYDPVQNPDAPASNAQKGELMRLARVFEWSDEERHRRAGVASFRDLTKGRANVLIDEQRRMESALLEDGDVPAPEGVVDGEIVDDGEGEAAAATAEEVPLSEPAAADPPKRTRRTRTVKQPDEPGAQPFDQDTQKRHAFVGQDEAEPCEACGWAFEHAVHPKEAGAQGTLGSRV